MSDTTNDDVTLTSGDDTYTVNLARDKVDGGDGIDTLVIDEEATIIISKDTSFIGIQTGISGKEYIYVKLGSEQTPLYTTAINFEFIEYQGVRTAVEDFLSNDIHDLVFASIPSYTVSDSTIRYDNIDTNTWSYNKGFTEETVDPKISFEIIKSTNSIVSDQISLTYSDNFPGPGTLLRMEGGTGGPIYETEVTIRATQSPDYVPSGIDNTKLYEDETFIVKLSDNEYPAFSISHSNFGQIVAAINSKLYNHYVINEGSTGKITINSSKAVENDTIFTISITGTGGSEYAGSLDISGSLDILIADAATDDLDGDLSIGSSYQVKILKGQSSVTFEIIATGDSDDENREEFSIKIIDEYSFESNQDYFIKNITPNPYFSETIDTEKAVLKASNTKLFDGTLNYSPGNDIIVLTGGGDTERGLSGDDTYIVSNLIPEDSSISIVDTSGSNKIQIPDNTFISKALFTSDAVRITLEDSREITINGADKFIYNLGANVTSGDVNDDLSYSDLASWFGIADVLSLSEATIGSETDLYII